MTKKVVKVGVREGYDLWAETYDITPNLVVAMDERQTLELLDAQPGERILDAGCGTGRNLKRLVAAGAEVCGIDFSLGMLNVACRVCPVVPFVVADLQRPLPFAEDTFDAVLCALIGEHLGDLGSAFKQMHLVLRPAGRLVFSVYHPALAIAGKEAHFECDGVEYRLGAHLHTAELYVELLKEAGFVRVVRHEFYGDRDLAEAVPSAQKYIGFPVLLVLEARK